MDVRYTYRLRPGSTARRYLAREWGMSRWLWNRLVAESEERFFWNGVALANGAPKDSLPTFGFAAQDKWLTHLRAVTRDPDSGERWLAAGSQNAQSQTVRAFAAARTQAIKDRADKSLSPLQRRGMPRFKSKHMSLATLSYNRNGFSIAAHPDTGRPALVLPGKVHVPVVWSRELPAAPSSVRVYQDSLGHWYASFVVTIDVDDTRLPTNGHDRAIGVDWGITETATTATIDTVTGAVDTSATYDLPHAQHGKKAAANLARYQRMMARRRTPKRHPNTKGYEHAKKQAAKAAKKVARQRRDDARKWAKRVVTDHDQIAVEDFKPKFLIKTTMARKAADAAIGATKIELVWQATKHGRDLRLVHPAHTTTDCFHCRARTKHRLPLGERTYTCETCGTTRPRDKNSALVMTHRAGFVPADVDGVRPVPATTRAPAA